MQPMPPPPREELRQRRASQAIEWIVRGAYRGAVLALLLAIGYDTSSQTTLLESSGGHGHLKFGAIVVIALIGAAVGGVVGLLGWGRHPRAR